MTSTKLSFVICHLPFVIFKIFLSNSWLPAIPYMQLLFLAGLLVPLHTVNLNILKVNGRSDLFLFLEIVKKALVVVVLLLSTKYGIFAILIGQITTSIISYIPNSQFSDRLIGYKINEQLQDICFPFFLAIGISAIIFVLINQFAWPDTVELLFFGSFSVFCYIFIANRMSISGLRIILSILKKES